MRCCTWDCTQLHRGGPVADHDPAHYVWYCTHDDAPKQPLPPDCHDARKGMLFADFVWGQDCQLLHPTGRLF